MSFTHSARDPFFAGKLRAPNLTIATGKLVTRISIDGRRATGVQWRAKNGESGSALARAEVILAAGALATPKLLMLSGVGPAEHLRERGIAVVHDSPGVGRNYQDHLEVSIYGRACEPISLLGNDRGLKALRHGLQWKLFRSGLLTSNVVESGGFVDTTGGDRPDIQFHVLPTLVGDVDREPLPGHGISINPCILRPKSRGSVLLRDDDPASPILFDSGALENESDVQALVRGVKLARRILRAPSLARVVSEEIKPSREADVSDRELEDYVRHHAKTVYHPAGTCRMGSDVAAVVSPLLKVNGVEGLRVCDASIMPTIVSGNTNAPTIMIAERCADFALAV